MDNLRHSNGWSRTQLNVIEIAIIEKATILNLQTEEEEDIKASHLINTPEHMV